MEKRQPPSSDAIPGPSGGALVTTGIAVDSVPVGVSASARSVCAPGGNQPASVAVIHTGSVCVWRAYRSVSSESAMPSRKKRTAVVPAGASTFRSVVPASVRDVGATKRSPPGADAASPAGVTTSAPSNARTQATVRMRSLRERDELRSAWRNCDGRGLSAYRYGSSGGIARCDAGRRDDLSAGRTEPPSEEARRRPAKQREVRRQAKRQRRTRRAHPVSLGSIGQICSRPSSWVNRGGIERRA